MFHTFLFCLCTWRLIGVFGDLDEVKSVSVMEGDSVTLYNNDPKINIYDLIMWRFGTQETLIKINREAKIILIFDHAHEGMFRDRLQVDDQTGSLTITNITTQHSGLYHITSIGKTKTSYTFNVTVYASLPVPVISRVSSHCSSSSESSNCSVLCSVMNVTHVSLSWYKGNSLLSSISVSDLNIRLSLPLEVEYQDTNTYTCVINNPITNQTQHLNITDVCQPCPESPDVRGNPAGIISAVVLAVVVLVVICILCKKHQRNKLKGNRFEPPEHTVETSEEEVHYADTTFCQQIHQKKRQCESETIYSSVTT